MYSNKIEVIKNKSLTRDYAQVKMTNFWLKKTMPILDNNLSFRDSIIKAFSTVSESVICISAISLKDRVLINAIHENIVNNNNRFYILLNTISEELKPLYSEALIRFETNNIGSFVLVAPNKGYALSFFFTGELSTIDFESRAHIGLSLDKNQEDVLYKLFVYTFWNKPKQEVKEQKTNKVPNSLSPINLNIGDFADKKNILEQWSNIESTDFCILSEANNILSEEYLSNLKNTTILTKFSPNHSSKILELVNNNNRIEAYSEISLDFNLLSYNGEHYWLYPCKKISNTINFYALHLNNNQVNIIKNKFAQPDLVFIPSKNRGDLGDANIIYNNDLQTKNIYINTHIDITLPAIKNNEFLPLDALNKLQPQFNDNGEAITITYNWDIYPFALPQGAQVHTLYKDWDKEKSHILSFISKIEKDIQDIENKNLLDKVRRFFLGKSIKFKKDKQTLEDLKTIDFSLKTKEEFNKAIQTILSIAYVVADDIEEITIAQDNALLDEDNAKLDAKIQDIVQHINQKNVALSSAKQAKEKAFEAFVLSYKLDNKIANIFEDLNKDLDKSIKDLEHELKSLTSKQSNLLEEIKKLNNRLKTPQAELKNLLDKQVKNAKEDLNDKIQKQEQSILDFENQIKEKEEEKAFLDLEVEEVISKQNQLKEQKEELSKINKMHNYSALEGDIQKLEKEKSNYENQKNINEKKKKIKLEKDDSSLEIFTISSHKNNLGLVINNLIPLPKIGKLWEHNKSLYLSIDYWEEYDLGVLEAERLKAKLCVTKLN